MKTIDHGLSAARQSALTAPLALLCLVPCFAASAGELPEATRLPDPTRPPALQRSATAGAAADTAASAPWVPVLQSVITGAGRKPSAIISGRLVELGDVFNGMRLVRLNEAGAVLSGPNGTATLAMTPAADKQLAPAAAAPAGLTPTRVAPIAVAPTAVLPAIAVTRKPAFDGGAIRSDEPVRIAEKK